MLHLTQIRFVASEALTRNFAGQDEELVYPLRISIRSESGVEFYNMEKKNLRIPIKGRALLKINADHDGFFVTSYSSTHLHKLITAAKEQKLSLRDCIGLSCDLKRLVSSGMNRTSDLLDLILGFREIDSYLVWETIERNLTAAQSAFKFSSTLIRNSLLKLSLDILGTKAHELGWDVSDDDDTTTAFKASMFSAAGLAGDEEFVELTEIGISSVLDY